MNTTSFIKVIINIVVRYKDLLDLKISDKKFVFIFNLLSLLDYFVDIKQKL